MKTILIAAIQKRSILQFSYRDHFRVVEPYAFGVSSANNDVLRCFQIEGTSHRGIVPCWGLMLISEIRDFIVTERFFTLTHHEYRRDDKGVTLIYEQH